MKKTFALAFIFMVLTKAGHTQNTLSLTLPEAEKRFLKENYQLLAQNYNIEQAKAEIITAKLFDNPEISQENYLYSTSEKKYLGTSYNTGYYSLEVSQLIKLAGKRNKNIQLANTGVKLEEYAYYDLIRTLRYELRSTFYKSYYLQQSAAVYKDQIAALNKLLAASEQQLKQGNIAGKEVIRIKSLLYSVNTEYNSLKNDIEELNTNLKVLIHVPAQTLLQLVAEPIHFESLKDKAYTALLDSAKTNRADLKYAQTAVTYAQQNLKLQKAMAIPDIELSMVYTSQNMPDKFLGMGVKLPLPLFNRNQGEIKKAKIAIDAQNNNYYQQENLLENEVYKSYIAALRAQELYDGMDKNFNHDFTQMMSDVTANFAKRNISLIEFLDFYESFKNNVLQYNQIRFDEINTKEEINYVTGTNIFK